jgi:hypothetical protein
MNIPAAPDKAVKPPKNTTVNPVLTQAERHKAV